MDSIDERKEYLTTYNIEDYLDEDPVIDRQNYCILSYILPQENNNLKYPLLKIRGSYRTVEDCHERIKTLSVKDEIFDMIITEVGKYGSLLPASELQKKDNIDIKYREAKLNEFVKGYKEGKERSKTEFDRRQEHLKKYGSTLEEDTTVSINDLQEQFNYFEKEIKHMNQEIDKFKDLQNKIKSKMDEISIVASTSNLSL